MFNDRGSSQLYRRSCHRNSIGPKTLLRSLNWPKDDISSTFDVQDSSLFQSIFNHLTWVCKMLFLFGAAFRIINIRENSNHCFCLRRFGNGVVTTKPAKGRSRYMKMVTMGETSSLTASLRDVIKRKLPESPRPKLVFVFTLSFHCFSMVF